MSTKSATKKPDIGYIVQFISAAAMHGMPVKMLRDVTFDTSFWQYNIKIEDGNGTPYTEPFLNNIILYDQNLTDLYHNGTLRSADTAVRSLYHEFAHAYMDMKDVDDTGMFKHAMAYYKGQQLGGGGTVDDPERVVNEAAGLYVGHRASTVWNMFDKMRWLGLVLDQVDRKEKTPVQGRREIDAILHLGPLPDQYNREMQNTVFGYQIKRDIEYQIASRPMDSGLQAYCDGVLLEDKIKKTFHQMPHLLMRYLKLEKRRADLRHR